MGSWNHDASIVTGQRRALSSAKPVAACTLIVFSMRSRAAWVSVWREA